MPVDAGSVELCGEIPHPPLSKWSADIPKLTDSCLMETSLHRYTVKTLAVVMPHSLHRQVAFGWFQDIHWFISGKSPRARRRWTDHWTSSLMECLTMLARAWWYVQTRSDAAEHGSQFENIAFEASDPPQIVQLFLNRSECKLPEFFHCRQTILNMADIHSRYYSIWYAAWCTRTCLCILYVDVDSTCHVTAVRFLIYTLPIFQNEHASQFPQIMWKPMWRPSQLSWM